jgi:hypothetical protein
MNTAARISNPTLYILTQNWFAVARCEHHSEPSDSVEGFQKIPQKSKCRVVMVVVVMIVFYAVRYLDNCKLFKLDPSYQT